MADKKKPTAKGRLKNDSHVNDTSGNAQRARLLARLRLGPVDTLTAIWELNIMRPGARIFELRALGYPIQAHLSTLKDGQGRYHSKVATYYLGTMTTKASEGQE